MGIQSYIQNQNHVEYRCLSNVPARDPFWEAFSNPFFFKIKLLPVKQAEVIASAKPIQNSLMASSFVTCVHSVVVEMFSVVFPDISGGVVVKSGDSEVFVAMFGRTVVLLSQYV